jgi:hypothetical protein
MYSVRNGDQHWGTTSNVDRQEQGRRTTVGTSDDEGDTDCLGEKREEKRIKRKRREKEEEVGDGLSFSLVTPNSDATEA